MPDPAAAAEAAAASNAALAVLDRQVSEAEARIALARAQRVPDPTLEATLTHGAAPEFDWGYRASVALPLPLFTRHDAAVHAEEASATQLRAQRDALAGRVRGAAWAAAVRALAQRQQYLRYRDLILPQSRQVEAMAQESYRTGQTNLAALLQSLQAARELRSQALQSAADFETAWAALQRADLGGAAMRRALLAAALLALGCHREAPEETETEAPVPVRVALPRTGPLVAYVRATGSVEPAPGAEWMVTSPAPARIAMLAFSIGDAVAKGVVVARFDAAAPAIGPRFPRRRASPGPGAPGQRPGQPRSALGPAGKGDRLAPRGG